MEKLQAVNRVLLGLGQRTVSSLATPHPVKDSILAQLQYAQTALLRRGWWFNSRDVMLYPTPDNIIQRPTTALAVLFDKSVDFSGQVLVKTSTGDTVFTTPVALTVAQSMDFEALPEAAAEYLVAMLTRDMYLTEYGLDNTQQQHQLNFQQAHSALRREEIRRLPTGAQTNKAFARITQRVRGG